MDGPALKGISRDVRRVGWMDGLRGVAAVQVMLLHYATAFLPAIGMFEPSLAHYRWELGFIQTPLFYPFDGYSAVIVFFVLSGVALTYSFGARPLGLVGGVGRRLVRLGVPMVASILFAALLWRLMPDQHSIAATVSKSEAWLGRSTPGEVSISSVMHQVFLEGLLAGYSETSMLPWRWHATLGLRSSYAAFNPPLWSLHAEFYGSMLILFLVAIRDIGGAKLHAISCALVAIAFAKSFVILFIVGHVAAYWLPSIASSFPWRRIGLFVCMVGILLCSMQTQPSLNGIIDLVYHSLPSPAAGPSLMLSRYQGAIGAILVFIGVAMSPACRRILQLPIFRWLGKISFSLYLTHFALLATAMCAIFNIMSQHYSYGISVAITSLIGISASFGIAILFERFVDRPTISLSRAVGGWGIMRVPVAANKV